MFVDSVGGKLCNSWFLISLLWDYSAARSLHLCTCRTLPCLPKLPHAPRGPTQARWHQVVHPKGPLCCICGIWSDCLSANTDMKGCHTSGGWVTSCGRVTAATLGVIGQIGSEREKHRGPLWPHNYPDWIHLADRRIMTRPPLVLDPRWSRTVAHAFRKGNRVIHSPVLYTDLFSPSSWTSQRLVGGQRCQTLSQCHTSTRWAVDILHAFHHNITLTFLNKFWFYTTGAQRVCHR